VEQEAGQSFSSCFAEVAKADVTFLSELEEEKN